MSLLDTVRRPEYTGERRCWPCTAVNAAIIALVCLLLAPFSYGFSLVVGAVGVGLVYLRGYAVPYTPAFAPKLVSRLPVDFGPKYAVGDGNGGSGSLGDVGRDGDGNATDTTDDDTGDDDTDARRSDTLTEGKLDGEALVRELCAAGVFADSDELYLTDAFVDEWTAEMSNLRASDRETLAAAAADAMPAGATWELDDEWVVLESDGAKTWLSESVATAETAVVRSLRSRGVDDAVAAHAANPLRMFLPECPVCGGVVEETTVRNCCGGTMGVYDSPDIEVLACKECDELLYEF
ncbi:hypothetical protein [Haloprofundus salilacus]|uniref:hypothetical protein n=1 Tax=Haloprofundus salilacus TaxID=2876190 RepID=UPI001CD00036|nr:hypothetical protein [Haloprofundus salilacus]